MTKQPKCTVADNGDKRWHLNGKQHREDGPAIEFASGTKIWYFNGKFHRIDGPAIEYADGSKFWYLTGKLHRIDGPAVEYADGDKFWYLNGKQFTDLSKFCDALKMTPEEKTIFLLKWS